MRSRSTRAALPATPCSTQRSDRLNIPPFRCPIRGARHSGWSTAIFVTLLYKVSAVGACVPVRGVRQGTRATDEIATRAHWPTLRHDRLPFRMNVGTRPPLDDKYAQTNAHAHAHALVSWPHEQRASFMISPCCVGKIEPQKSVDTQRVRFGQGAALDPAARATVTFSRQRIRSKRLQAADIDEPTFTLLARVSDTDQLPFVLVLCVCDMPLLYAFATCWLMWCLLP